MEGRRFEKAGAGRSKTQASVYRREGNVIQGQASNGRRFGRSFVITLTRATIQKTRFFRGSQHRAASKHLCEYYCSQGLSLLCIQACNHVLGSRVAEDLVTREGRSGRLGADRREVKALCTMHYASFFNASPWLRRLSAARESCFDFPMFVDSQSRRIENGQKFSCSFVLGRTRWSKAMERHYPGFKTPSR